MILVVDDHPVCQLLTGKQLERFGIRSMSTDSGWDAYELIRDNDFKLVFMDVHLKDLFGTEVTRMIRRYEEAHHQKHTPIIAVTMDADYKACINAGMDIYIQKPMLLHQMQKILKEYGLISAEEEDIVPMWKYFPEMRLRP